MESADYRSGNFLIHLQPNFAAASCLIIETYVMIWVTSLPRFTGEDGISNLILRRLMYALRHFDDYKKMHFSAFLKEQKPDLTADFFRV